MAYRQTKRSREQIARIEAQAQVAERHHHPGIPAREAQSEAAP